MKTVLLAPLDPVHDNAVKLLQRRLSAAGYEAVSMPPGTRVEEVVQKALQMRPQAILISRTLGYQVAETLCRLVDLCEAAGLREHTRLGVGGMAITREVGAELGFDAVFVGELDMAQVLAFIEGHEFLAANGPARRSERTRPDITEGYSYQFHNRRIESLLNEISEQILDWAKNRTSAGIRRAELRRRLLACEPATSATDHLRERYIQLCGPEVQAFYRQGKLPSGVRRLEQSEVARLPEHIAAASDGYRPLRPHHQRPLIFVQYGTGCPLMDVVHIKTSEAWGADGLLHFDPSWGAQCEGLLEGLLSHEHDGTILTLENLHLIGSALDPASLWNVRGHRGLNTPETQVLAQAAGAHLLKINIPYGCTGGGTDPERLTVDGLYSLQLAAEFGLPFDIPGNDELSGVPPHKTFAGLLIMTMLGLKLGAKPIPKPLLCNSPYMTLSGLTDDNLVDINIAKFRVWREIIDAPIWPGEPVGFMTHSPERVQSAMTTAAHVALAASQGAAALTMASTDEAYSKGPISLPARVDSLRAVREMLRFIGSAGFQATPAAEKMQADIHAGILTTLEGIARRRDFVAAIHEGLLGSPEDGLYPGRVGRGTVELLN